MSDLLAAALDYAARGLPVFPCVPRGKTPAIARGFHAATTNPATIRRYWTDPDRNIGIPTGASSRPLGARHRRRRGRGEPARRSRRDTEPFRKRAAWSLLAVVMRGLHIAGRFRRAPAGSVPASISAVMAVTSIAPPSIHQTGHRYAFLGDPWQRARHRAAMADRRRPRQARTLHHRARRGDDPPALRCRRLRPRRSASRDR